MRWNKDGHLALGLALGFMGALAAFVWLNATAQLGFCGPDENYGACIREWVGALSGWAAAIAAVVTLFALYSQLAALYDQLAEQRKQTNFTVGDAMPTMDFVRVRRAKVAVLRIVNWNRRTLIWSGNFEIANHNLNLLQAYRWEIDGEAEDAEGPHCWPLIIPGWEDRSKPPHHARVFFTVAKDGDPLDQDGNTKIGASMLLADEHNRRIGVWATMTSG
ncbi:hypothetical protein [Hoeflea sp. 108]|uniref:hypothetical protein n=1 Tax=Hoeflea sp. 108 TaxID=1116369 RepID=UPI0003699C47|nr:hypothetical protein [Hoeflea sp. 108]